jgi:hypothetical protein
VLPDGRRRAAQATLRYGLSVNFIGHATVALWRRNEPEFVLGSMLPDFAGMAGTRLSRSPPLPSSPEALALAEGIALHHTTDDAFHGAPGFVTLLQETLDELTARGVSRATARAVGHVGTELLIDGELVHASEVAGAYTSALAVERSLEGVFIDAEGTARWGRLRERLLDYGVPYDYREPDAVLRRLQLVLHNRPRLAITADALPLIRAHLPALQRKVRIALPALLDSVRAGVS